MRGSRQRCGLTAEGTVEQHHFFLINERKKRPLCSAGGEGERRSPSHHGTGGKRQKPLPWQRAEGPGLGDFCPFVLGGTLSPATSPAAALGYEQVPEFAPPPGFKQSGSGSIPRWGLGKESSRWESNPSLHTLGQRCFRLK